MPSATTATQPRDHASRAICSCHDLRASATAPPRREHLVLAALQSPYQRLGMGRSLRRPAFLTMPALSRADRGARFGSGPAHHRVLRRNIGSVRGSWIAQSSARPARRLAAARSGVRAATNRSARAVHQQGRALLQQHPADQQPGARSPRTGRSCRPGRQRAASAAADIPSARHDPRPRTARARDEIAALAARMRSACSTRSRSRNRPL